MSRTTRILHWLGWSVLPLASLLYYFTFWEYHERVDWDAHAAGMQMMGPFQMTGTFVLWIAIFCAAAFGFRKFQLPCCRDRSERRYPELRYLILNALAIGAAGMAMVVALVPFFWGYTHPWMETFILTSVYGMVVCCPRFISA